MKLITEEISNVKIITEGKGSGKKLYIEGVFLQGNIKNRNGRMYPMETLAREVKRYNETFVNKGRALGELGHPDGPTVNLDRVSHKITSLSEDGNNFKGKAQILNTPMGKIASSLLDEGVMLGVSSRGVGSLKTTNEGHKIVGEDFKHVRPVKFAFKGSIAYIFIFYIFFWFIISSDKKVFGQMKKLAFVSFDFNYFCTNNTT